MYVWVRRTVDWADEEAFRAQLDPAFAATVALWDATFTVPFHAFRARVRAIAERNWEGLDGVAAVADWHAIPDGAVVLPADDDDWFAPDVATVLERRWDGRGGGVSWASSFVEVPLHRRHALGLAVRRAVPRIPPKHWCTTNNYAVLKGAGAREAAASHLRASAALRDAPRLTERLSCMNRTLGSQTSLRGATRERLVARWAAYRRLYRSERRAPAWCAPYVAAMGRLMDDVEPR